MGEAGYELAGYGHMMADAVRMDAYAAALERAVRPGSVVLDIGTGAGMMAFLACRLGARRVFAIEPADAIHAAREMARANGFADRIHFIHDVSTRATLPEPADVVVADLRGSLPLFGQALPSLVDARERLMAPGGLLVPRRDTLYAAVASAPEAYDRVVGPWTGAARGFDLSHARRVSVNRWSKAHVPADGLLTDARPWTTLDYHTLTSPDARGTVEWTVDRAGTAHGVCMWFHAELVDGVAYASGPLGPRTVYGTAFFPWPQPVHLSPGDRVTADIRARLVGDDYVWIWNSRILPATGDAVDFRQSTFFAEPLSPDRLRIRAHDHRPTLSEDGRIDRMILGRMDGGATLEEIAREVAAAFPGRFATWQEALTRAGRLAEAYGA